MHAAAIQHFPPFPLRLLPSSSALLLLLLVVVAVVVVVVESRIRSHIYGSGLCAGLPRQEQRCRRPGHRLAMTMTPAWGELMIFEASPQ